MAELSVDVAIEVKCSCGRDLVVINTEEKHTNYASYHLITVEPCDDCIENAT